MEKNCFLYIKIIKKGFYVFKINNEIFPVGLVDEKTNLISSLENDKLHVLKEKIDFEIYKRKIKQ